MSDESGFGIGYLAGSPTRSAILERLTEGAARPATLVEYAGVSRTTVHRTLAELVERDWVRRNDGSYVATVAGRRALETYRTARSRFRTLERVEPFLAHLGEAVADLELEWLASADLASASETTPHYPVEWYADRLEETAGDRLRGLSPVVSRAFMTVHEPIVERGTHTALVLGESALSVAAERYPDAFRQSVAREEYDLYVAGEAPPMGLTVVADAVFVGAYDENGHLAVVLESDDERLREWALERYRAWRDDARPVTDASIAH